MTVAGRDRFPQFRAATQGEEEYWNLFEAALWLGEDQTTPPDVAACDARVQAFVEEIRRRGIGPEDGEGAVRALSAFLFSELGYSGNQQDYYDPGNSYLHVVLQSRLGLPISLSVLLQETARRLGISIEGVGFPGHFLSRWNGPQGPVYIDAFHGGRVVLPDELVELLRQTLGADAQIRKEHLAAISKRQTLIRMLRNLQVAYLRRGDPSPALAAVDRILLLSPEDGLARRDRAELVRIVSKRR